MTLKPRQLVARSLRYYWRTNLAVVLGVATAVAVLAGALVVGDSVRGSLRDLVVQRLGRTDRVVVSSGFFREALAGGISADPRFTRAFTAICPLIAVEGAVTDQATGRRASRVQVYGVDERFWTFHAIPPAAAIDGRQALVSRALAADIGAVTDGTVLVRLQQPSSIPIESLHGRKDDLGRTVRLAVRAIVDPAGLGEFSLRPQQGGVRAVFVPLARLQKDLDVDGRVNALLVADRPSASAASGELEAIVRRRAVLEDVGLRVRAIDTGPGLKTRPTSEGGLTARTFSDVGRVFRPGGVLAIESPAGLIDAPRAAAIDAAAGAAGFDARPVLTYLANTIRSGDRQVPYSLVSAMDLAAIAPALKIDATATPPPIVLNDWAARDLGVSAGDPLALDYYVWEDPGLLVTRSAAFRVAGIVPIEGAAADRDLTPAYPGITEAQTFADWDPPFPIDLKRVGPIDEQYWKEYRTTPKAFVPLEVGQTLWRSRHGDRTAVRIAARTPLSLPEVRDRFMADLRDAIDPLALGLSIHDVRSEGLAASRGATDFGEYFTYFSFFLVMSALLLAALFFRLGVEQRAREIGLLRSVGFTLARVRGLFVAEGLLLAAIGSAIGIAGAVGYGSLMMAGLRTWWSGAVGTTALTLHASPASLAAGATGAAIAAMACIWWTLGALARVSERGLLAGDLTAGKGTMPGSRRPLVAALLFGVSSVALVVASAAGAIEATGAFFGAGTAMLAGSLCVMAFWLRIPPRSALGGHGWWPVARLGLRNAADRPGRSVLAIGVIASAGFVLISVEAFRRQGPAPADRHSGTGGYSLLVELTVPLAHHPSGREGPEMVGIQDLTGVSIEPIRLRPGDDASCLNLYEPRNPRIAGVRREFIEAGRFAFQSALASNDAERANPWLILEREFEDGVVPVIADANSITYVLHKKLGDEVLIDTGGRPARLRLVAALDDSLFQSELLMSAANFVRLFPEQAGYRLLLVETPAPAEVADAIENGAADLGADATVAADRLAEFHRVENTYLSTFQTLGGLGLLVGTIGLAAVLLRNVLERRRELALLGASGYRRGHIFAIVVAENALLVGCGLAVGAFCALVAIAPAALDRGGRLPVTPAAGLLLVAVFVAGLLSSLIATRAALRAPLLEALRGE